MKNCLVKNRLVQLHTLLILSAIFGAAQWVKADNEVWIGNPGVTTTTNWSDTANWSGTAHNPNDNTLFFGNNGPASVGTVDNVVDTSTNCSSLNFTNTSTTHTTLILPSQTLTIDGNNGGPGINVNPLGAVITTNSITGANGTLLITGTSAGGVFVASTNNTGSGVAPLLDMSGLGTFIISNATASAVISIGNGANRSDGILFLAKTNYLALPGTGTGTSAALVVGANTSNNGSSPGGVLNLGQTNTILADNISVGMAKQTVALMRFNPAFTNGGANPVVYIRGNSGNAVKLWSIGNGLAQSGTSVGGSGTVNFNSGTVNAVVTAMVLGMPSSSATTAGFPSSTGTLSFNAGNISVITLTNGAMSQPNISTLTNTATGNINVTGTATLSVNNLIMAVYTSGLITSFGTLNITNGTVTAGTITSGGGTNTININNGTLIVTNTAGTPATPLTAMNLINATLTLPAAVTASTTVSTLSSGGTTNTINVSSVPPVTAYPAQFPLIKYVTSSGDLTIIGLGTLPGIFQGYISNNTANLSVDVVLTGGPPTNKPVVWNGTVNGNWDTTTANWKSALIFNQNDFTTFDDTALGTTTVNLTTAITPGSLTINNSALNYTFNGTGGLNGSTGLTKQGSGTLILDNSGLNNFSGGVTISAGTLQFGNNDINGNLPAIGNVTDNGSLVISRSDSNTVANVISGSGSVTNNGSGTLTLSAANSFTGNLTINAGTVRPTAVRAPGAGTLTVNSGGALVLMAGITNPITLAGGTLGISSAADYTSSTNTIVTAAAGTTSVVQLADPQNPNTTRNIQVDGLLLGSGNILVINATNVSSVDGGQGFRLRGTNLVSTFSGTITFSNNVKGELLTSAIGTFSPAGTGKFKLVCGAFDATNTLTGPITGGYSEFNIRNNGPTNIVMGNDVEIVGTGTTILDPIGSAPVGCTTTMGNLKVGGGQEVGVYLGAVPNHVLVFPTVTLTGGNAKFSPKTPGFGSLTSVGSDLSFGNISEQTAGSGIIMAGWRTLFLTGTNTYSGNTLISNGTLALTGSATISNTPNITIASGATLDVSGLTNGTFALGSGQTLTGSGGTGTINSNVNMNLGSLALSYINGTATLTETNGTLTFNNNNIAVTVLGATPLTGGSYKLISAGTAGLVAGSVGSSALTVGGAGVVAGHPASLSIVSGELYLVVTNRAPVANIVANSVTSGETWKIAISALKTAAGWSDPDGDPVTFNSVNSPSAKGTNITSDSSYIYYNGPVTSEDHFTYTITDGTLTGIGTVYLEAVAATAPRISNPATDGNGHPTFSGNGISGYTYGVESATSLSGPWFNAGTVTAGANGSWSFTDASQSHPPIIFYRLYYPYSAGSPPQ
jgi:fibronectin-binding autotransporter adhesin